jgi:hypothetical protein
MKKNIRNSVYMVAMAAVVLFSCSSEEQGKKKVAKAEDKKEAEVAENKSRLPMMILAGSVTVIRGVYAKDAGKE